jgi:hypothetical protein
MIDPMMAIDARVQRCVGPNNCNPATFIRSRLPARKSQRRAKQTVTDLGVRLQKSPADSLKLVLREQ